MEDSKNRRYLKEKIEQSQGNLRRYYISKQQEDVIKNNREQDKTLGNQRCNCQNRNKDLGDKENHPE